jgi:hypothetical protein
MHKSLVIKKDEEMNNKRCFFLVVFIALIFSTKMFCMIAPTNFYQSYDSMLRRSSIEDAKISCGVLVEAGSKGYARTHDGLRHNVLQIYSQNNNIAKMLTNYEDVVTSFPGFPTGCEAKDFAGHDVKFNGGYAGVDFTLYSKFVPFGEYKYIPGIFSFDVLLPLKNHTIKKVTVDKTGVIPSTITNAPQKKDFEDFISIFEKQVQLTGIDLSGVGCNGLGDLTMLVNWDKSFNFRGNEKYFCDISLFGKVGVTLPTSPKKHVDKIFAMPIGNDGHLGFPFGLGLSCDVVKNCKAGVTFDFFKQKKKTKMMRVKTDVDQGEFLLLNKSMVRKSPGFTWQFSPFISLVDFGNGWSLKLAYQHQVHKKDSLSMSDGGELLKNINKAKPDSTTDEKLHESINSANSLKKWKTNNIILQTHWDVGESVKDCPGAPQLNFFYKRALSARNIIDTNTFGGQLTFNF